MPAGAAGWTTDAVPGSRTPAAHLEEERERRLGGGLVDPGASPAQDLIRGSYSCAAVHSQASRRAIESSSLVRTAQPSGRPMRDAPLPTHRPKLLSAAAAWSTTATSSR